MALEAWRDRVVLAARAAIGVLVDGVVVAAVAVADVVLAGRVVPAAEHHRAAAEIASLRCDRMEEARRDLRRAFSWCAEAWIS